MRQLTPAQIAADIKAARAAAYATIQRITHPVVTPKSSFAAAIEASHAKPARVYEGHAGDGGLQTHSVGGLYPWMTPAFGDGTFGVENAVTGQKLTCRFDDYEAAAEWAERLKAGEPFEAVERYLNAGQAFDRSLVDSYGVL